MRFRIDLKIFLFLLLFYLTKQIEAYAMIMMFAFLHELGHLITGMVVGMKPDKLEIMPFGVGISFQLQPKDYNQKVGKGNRLELKKIGVAFAGPITNILIIVITSFLPIDMITKLMIFYANIIIIIFNLLPIYPLDGGRILKSILHIAKGKRKANKLIDDISIIVAMIITAISSIAILYLENIAIFIIILYIWLLIIKEHKKYKQKEKLYQILDQT